MEKEKEQEESVESFMCPSFSDYSSAKLTHIADQVTRDHSRSQNDNDFHANDDDDSDFEFVAFRKAEDGVLLQGCAGTVFPIFNRDLAGEISGTEEIRFPMEKLVIGGEEDRRRDSLSSAESSEVEEELEGIPAGTYCVWKPKPVVEASPSPSRCKKSNSTGSSSSSSKRWKLLDLLRRSNSDGKDSFVFLTPSLGSNSGKKKEKTENWKEQRGSKRIETGGGRVAGKKVSGSGEKNVAAAVSVSVSVSVSAHEALYVRNREMRRVDNRRSFLPYRQDLVGFCASLNGMGRAFPPF